MTLRTTKGNSQAQDIEDLLHVNEGARGVFENAQLNQQFALKSYIGISRLRDRMIEDGTELTDPKTSSRLVNQLGEYEVTAPAAGNSSEFLSAQFGRYIPGYIALGAAGVRVPSQPSGDAFIEWGYGNTQGVGSGNRLAFGWDADSPYITLDKDGSQEFIKRQSEWNLDKLDGSGPNADNPSGLTLDITRGNIFRIVFTWYGYGDAFWVVKMPDKNGVQFDIPVHVFSPDKGTSIGVPDAPIGILVDNGTTGTEHKGYIAGRAFGTIGGPTFADTERLTPERRIDASVANGAWSPIIVTRRKTLSQFAAVGARPSSIDIIRADNDVLFGLFVGAEISDGTWKNAPEDGDAGETTLEFNNTATTISTLGLPVLGDGVVGGGGSNTSGEDIQALGRLLPDRDPLMLAAYGLGSTATVSAYLNMQENW